MFSIIINYIEGGGGSKPPIYLQSSNNNKNMVGKGMQFRERRPCLIASLYYHGPITLNHTLVLGVGTHGGWTRS